MYSFQHSDSKRVSIEVLFQDSSSFVHSKSVCPSPVAFCEQTERAALKRWDRIFLLRLGLGLPLPARAATMITAAAAPVPTTQLKMLLTLPNSVRPDAVLASRT